MRAKIKAKVEGLADRLAARTRRAIETLSARISVTALIGLFAVPLLPLVGAHVRGDASALAGLEIVRARPVAVGQAQDDEGLAASAEPAAVRKQRGQRTRPAAVQSPGKIEDPQPVQAAAAQTPAAQSTPAQAQAAQPAQAQATAWSDADVAAALKTCLQVLGPLAATVDVLPALRQEQCGTPAPVALKRLGTGAEAVEITPPAVLNCAMVAKLNTWVEQVLQPTARDLFKATVTRLNGTSGYVCRGRNGDTRADTTKLSEHALANALDVTSFTLSDGRTIDVGRNWGPAKRDAVKAGSVEPAKKLAAQAPSRLGRGLPEPGQPDASAAASAEGQFLRRLHQGACRHFGTVLGPEANEAHREHFHFDLAPRRHSAFCQ